MILEIFPSGPLQTNAYLIGCSKTKRAAIIDAPLGSSEALLKSIKRHALHMQMLLLTHSHWDHIADAAVLKEKTNAPLYVHEKDAENIKNPGSDRLPLFFSLSGVQPDGYLTDGQIIELGELSLHVIHTPGHSPGGVSFYLPQQETLFSGDTLFSGSIGSLSLPTAHADEMWSSLKKLAALPKKTKVYPGHGGATTIEKESWIADAEQRYS